MKPVFKVLLMAVAYLAIFILAMRLAGKVLKKQAASLK